MRAIPTFMWLTGWPYFVTVGAHELQIIERCRSQVHFIYWIKSLIIHICLLMFNVIRYIKFRVNLSKFVFH